MSFEIRRAKRVVLAAVAALLAVLASGCVVTRAGGRAFVSFFESPREVKNRIKQPVRKDARLAVLWVGHATALVQIDDKIVLTDPVFTSTVGQLSKRLVEPGIDPDDLPPIDAVIVSHMHFDHFSLGSLAMLEKKIRTILLPRGGTTYLTDFSFPVVELHRWQPWEKDGLRITAVPVDHVGFRYGLDDAWMKESFTGYVVEYHGMKVYFAGDTAYDQSNFVETGQRFPGIDVALLPIGPIEPRDLMRRFHIDPNEALQAFFDLGAKRLVPVHYDTFVNSGDNPGDAVRMLAAAQARYDMTGRVVAPLQIGEQRVFLKAGEDPAASKVNAVAPQPPRPPEKPWTPPIPTAKPKPKEEIPEDDRLD